MISTSATRRSRLWTRLEARWRPHRLGPAALRIFDHQGNRGPSPFAAEDVGELVGGDRKQIGLERGGRIVVGQAHQKAQERVLNDVFARGPIAEAAVDKRQQPPFITGDDFAGLLVAATNGGNQQRFGVVGRHAE